MMCILAIFLVASASATDLNESDVVNVDEEIMFDNNDELMSVEDNDEISASNESEVLGTTHYLDSNVDMWSAISNANAGDTLVLTGGTYYIWDYGLSKSLTFIGQNNAVLSTNGKGDKSMFLVNANVVFKNITFIGQSAQHGNIFPVYSGLLTVDNCIFKNCYASKNGGAIHCTDSGTCKISNSKFIGTRCDGDGGAIRVRTGGEIINCTFNNCYGKYGGAIQSEGSTNLKILNSQFIECTSNYGGAIRIGGGTRNLLIKGCTFKSNGASQDGGAISRFDSDVVNVEDSYFEGNSAQWGGAIYQSSTNGRIYNSTFKSNRATTDSGAVSGGTISYCTFIDNWASSFGGATAWSSSDHSRFENNHADGNGGAIYAGTASDCTFRNNGAGSNGGAINMNGQGTIARCSFTGDSAKYGGAVNVAADSVTLSNCEFSQCSSTQNGAAVYSSSGSNLKITGGNFEGCTSKSIAFANSGSSYSVVDCIFDIAPSGVKYSYDTILQANDVSIIQGETGKMIVKLSNVEKPLAFKPLTLTLNGKSDTRTTDKNGEVSFTVNNFVYLVREYEGTLSYEGDELNSEVTKSVKVTINSYKGNLQVSQVGKYYHDTSLAFNLINSKTNEAIPYANIRLTFATGHEVSLQTDKKGTATYDLDFNSGSYDYTARVVDDCVDVNTVKSKAIINSINGKIEVNQYGRIFKFKLYNPSNNDVFRNIDVNIQFTNVDSISLKTNDAGMITYNFPEDNGTYDLFVTVDANPYREFAPVELKNIKINSKYDPSLNDAINSTITLGDPIVFDYSKSGKTTVFIVGGSIGSIGILNNPKAKVTVNKNIITVSNLAVGTYTLYVKCKPRDNYYPSEAKLKVTVNKVHAVIVDSQIKVTVPHKKATSWTVRIVDSKTGNPIKGLKLTLKIYTGKNHVKRYITTNSKGVASYQTKKLSRGNHKVVLSLTHPGYKLNTFTSSIKVIKQTKLKFKDYKYDPSKKGTILSFQVTDKKTKKPVNGIKVRFLIKIGKKYKPITLKTTKTKTIKDKHGKKINGIAGFFTNARPAGKYSVKIEPVSIKYSGFGKKTIKIKKSAKKYTKKEYLT